MDSAAGVCELLPSSRFWLCGLQQHQRALWLQPKHSQRLQPVVPVRRVLPNHSSLWNTCLCPSVSRVWGFFSPHCRNVASAHSQRVSSKSKGQIVFSLRFYVAFVLYPHSRRSAQQHSLPKHRAESRPQAYQFLRQSSHNSSRATEQERLKEGGAKVKESLGRL